MLVCYVGGLEILSIIFCDMYLICIFIWLKCINYCNIMLEKMSNLKSIELYWFYLFKFVCFGRIFLMWVFIGFCMVVEFKRLIV